MGLMIGMEVNCKAIDIINKLIAFYGFFLLKSF